MLDCRRCAERVALAHPILWDNGVMRDLGLFPGDDDGWAGAINEGGQIVGSSGRTDPQTYQPSYRAFLYENGVMTALPVRGTDSYAGDINDSGVVVGAMKVGAGVFNYDAFIYADGVVTNLNSLIPSGSGLRLRNAVGIRMTGRSSAWPTMHRTDPTPSCSHRSRRARRSSTLGTHQ